MDLASLIGTVMVFILILFGITFDPNEGINLGALAYFIDLPSIFIVVFGTFAAGVTAYPLESLMRFGTLVKKVFQAKRNTQIQTLVSIVDISKIARKNILAVEDSLPSIENKFLRGGLRMIVDRMERALVTEVLVSETKYRDLQNESDVEYMKTLSTLSPAFGMIGTLIGLVILLQNLDDPSKIGPAMAIALITTLYGSILSNAVFLPWSIKLLSFQKNEKNLNEMIRDGILLIEKGERAESVEQVLMNYLSPELRKKYEELKYGV